MPALASDLVPRMRVRHDRDDRVGSVSEFDPMLYDGTTYFWIWWDVPRGKSGSWVQYKEVSIARRSNA